MDLDDMQVRLNRSEQVKEASLKELERLECDNAALTSDNNQLRVSMDKN